MSETALFKNVEMGVPKLADVPDKGYPAKVESTIEVLDVDKRQSPRRLSTEHGQA